MLFKRKPKLSLQLAIYLCEQITDIAYSYKNDRAFTPASVDIRRFEELVEKLWETHATVQYITHCMHQRALGEEEGSRKFIDPEVAEYHRS